MAKSSNTNRAVMAAAQEAGTALANITSRFQATEAHAQRQHDEGRPASIRAVMSRGQIHVLMKDAHKTVEFFGADVAVTVTQEEG
jgi:hypothetical protein